MTALNSHETMLFFLGLGVLLFTARLLGELAQHWRQPAVLGELLAGILLGPTVLGQLAPDLNHTLFPSSGSITVALSGLTNLAVALFLLVAGMEVDLSTIWRRGKPALTVGAATMLLPFGLGFVAAWYVPRLVGYEGDGSDRLVFALFIATALAITALPVIAKILIDLHLFRTELGMTTVAAAILNDLLGWIIFAMILGMMGGHGQPADVWRTVVLTLGFVIGMLTVGRVLLDRFLPFIQARASWPGGVLGFTLAMALFCAALTEWIGIHAIFGTFIFGVALGDSRHLRERTRLTLDQFISFILTPLFFGSVGLKVNFVSNFDLGLVLVIIAIGTVGKVIGGLVGGRLGGLSLRDSWAIGCGMNARGVMEIILGVLALNAHLITEHLFVALVVFALVTSMTSGALMQRILGRRRTARFVHYLTASTYVPRLRATTRQEVIDELCRAVCAGTTLDPRTVAEQVWEREQLQATGLEHGLAVPHARLVGLKQPRLAVGISPPGVDFQGLDNQPARLIVLMLTPADAPDLQLELLKDLGRSFHDPASVPEAVRAATYTEFLAHINAAPHHEPR